MATIMDSITDLPTLQNLVSVSSIAEAVFEHWPVTYLTKAMCNIPSELHQIIMALVWFSQEKPDSAESVIKFVDRYLGDSDHRLPAQISNPLALLKMLGKAADAVELLTIAYAKSWFPALPMSEEWPVYASEAHRIKRALWRYEIYSRLFYIPAEKETERHRTAKPEQLIEQQERFLRRLAPWEVVELECVNGYLSGILQHAQPSTNPTTSKPNAQKPKPTPSSLPNILFQWLQIPPATQPTIPNPTSNPHTLSPPHTLPHALHNLRQHVGRPMQGELHSHVWADSPKMVWPNGEWKRMCNRTSNTTTLWNPMGRHDHRHPRNEYMATNGFCFWDENRTHVMIPRLLVVQRDMHRRGWRLELFWVRFILEYGRWSIPPAERQGLEKEKREAEKRRK
ncbi:hypothetical protein MMC12_001933 [Toensbergia leucococca]|nr:hypothetical protein [Toensbergia leucococca]